MKVFKRLDSAAQQRLAWGLLIAGMALYIIVMSIQSILRYATFKATAFDLGNMDQVLWNTIHGRPFQFTNQAIDWYGPPTRLAVHVEPIMLVISLLYAFHADPRILLIFQTLVLAAGAPAVFLLSRRYLPAWPVLAAVMSGAYLLSPAVLGINIFDFHPDSVATPLFLYAILAVTYRRYIWFLILCFLACACKEDMPLAVAFFGILLIWKYRLPRLGLTLLIGGALWAYIAFKVVIPHFYTGVQANNFWYRYEVYGSTPAEAVVNLVTHPWLFFSTVLTLSRFYYIFSLLRSTGFLALLAPEWLLPALPKFASNILSDNGPNTSGVYHYNAAIVPFVMLSAIHGMRRLIYIWQGWGKRSIKQSEMVFLVGKPAPDTEQRAYPIQWIPVKIQLLAQRVWAALQRFFQRFKPALIRLARPVWSKAQDWWEALSVHMHPFTRTVSPLRLQWVFCIWLIFCIGLNYFIAIPQLNSFWADHWPGTREAQIQQLLDLIPPQASVSASDDLNPHLSERRLVTVFPSICLDTVNTINCSRTVDYIIVDLNSPTLGNRANAIKELNALSGPRGQFQLIKNIAGVDLLKRRST